MVAPFGSEGTQTDLNTGKRTNVAGGTTEQTTIPNVLTTPQGPIQIGQNVVTKNVAGNITDQIPVSQFKNQAALIAPDDTTAPKTSSISLTGEDINPMDYLLQIARQRMMQQQQPVSTATPLTSPLVNRNSNVQLAAY